MVEFPSSRDGARGEILCRVTEFKYVSFPRCSGKELVPSSSAKDLGVILDPHLTFDGHVLKTVSYCMSSVAHINFLFPLCSAGRRLSALKYIVS